MTRPQLIFGGAAIGENAFNTVDAVKALLTTLTAARISRVDTASAYPPATPGRSEQLLGDTEAVALGFTVDTKIRPIGEGPGKGSLKPSAIDASLTESLHQLGVDQVNVLYCHLPDTETSIEETAGAFQDHYKKKHFKHFGVSNFSPEQLEELLKVCDEKGYVKPSYYQGQYNALCRRPEDRLLQIVRKHNMSFIAFSPLAGGFLTGKLTKGGDLSGTRFADGNQVGSFYKGMYDKPVMHSVMEELQSFLQPRGVSPAEASLRWLCYHSALGEDDGIILGASKISQFEANMEDLSHGPLPAEVVEVFERIWKSAKQEAP